MQRIVGPKRVRMRLRMREVLKMQQEGGTQPGTVCKGQKK